MAALTPAAWLQRLEPRLNDRWMRPRDGMGVHDAYFEGDHNLAFATAKYREAFGSLLNALADNWMPLVVESSVERLKVQGFRFGKQQSADDAAWELWQANNLDESADLAHTEAVKLGESYWLVAPGKGSDPPTITDEHPSQVIVACDPANRRRRLAALKKWKGEDGYAYAIVYLPEWIAHYRSQKKLQAHGGTKIDWQPDDGASGPNPLSEVPLIPLRNARTMLGGGVSDLKVAQPIQDTVNKLLADMLVGSEYLAFPQRVFLGVEVPKGADGMPTRAAQVQFSEARAIVVSNKDARTAEFSAADLNNYVNARQHLIRGLTAKTRTPPHYVLGEIVNASGDALKAAETGLVAKVRKKMPAFEAAHEDMMRLAFKAMKDTERANVKDSEIIWRDPESRTEGELTDAMTKQKTLGIPEEVLWERLGYSPQQIARMKAMQATEDLLNPTPEPPPVVQNGNGQVPPEQAPAVVANARP